MSFDNGQQTVAAGNMLADRSGTPYALETIAIIRPHWSRLMLPNLVLALSAAATVFGQNRLDRHSFETYLLPAAGIVALLFWFLPSLRVLTNRLEIDAQTLVYKHGQFGLKTESLAFAAIASVALRRKFLAAALRSGDLVITSVTGSEIVVRSVPRVKTVVKALQGVQTSSGMQTPARIGL
jgi:hypothetical protein